MTAEQNVSLSVGRAVGSILFAGCAFLISFALHKSILWALLHALFGLFYIIYAIIMYGSQIDPAIRALFGMGV